MKKIKKEINEFFTQQTQKLEEMFLSNLAFQAYILGRLDAVNEEKEVIGLIESNIEEIEHMKYKGNIVKKRKDGRWYARIRLEKGIYKFVYGRTQKACYDNLKEFLNDDIAVAKYKNERLDRRKKSTVTTLSSFYVTWLEVFKRPNCKESTIKNHVSLHRNYLSKSNIINMDISKIKGLDIQKFLSTIPYNSQRQKCYKMLRDIFNTAYNNEIIKRTPMLGIKMPTYHPREQQAFSKSEEKKFVAAAKNSEYWTLYALMLYQGLRTGEAKALRHCDIFDTYIYVGASLDNKNNIVTTKSNKSRRVPIFKKFECIADELRSDSTDLIFGEGVNKHTGNVEYRALSNDLKIRHAMYSLRHTFATRCAEKGITAKQVQLWLGHSSVDITLKYYTNINDEFEKSNVNKKNEL